MTTLDLSYAAQFTREGYEDDVLGKTVRALLVDAMPMTDNPSFLRLKCFL